MHKRSSLLGRCLVACLSLLAIVPAAACGGWVKYTVTELGAPPEARVEGTKAYAINNRNQVVGRVHVGPLHWRAVMWEGDRLITLGTLGGGGQAEADGAYAINDAGQVAGASWSDGNERAFRWTNGRMERLRIPGAGLSVGVDINEAGDVAGAFVVAGGDPRLGERTFLWRNGEVRDLGPRNGNVGSGTALGEHGQVVGTRLADPADPSSPQRAFLWDGDTARDLGTLPGGTMAWATGIAASSWPPDEGETNFTVVGVSSVPKGTVDAPFLHGFVYTRRRMTDIGTLTSYPHTLPHAVNAGGVVVGRVESENRQKRRAFIYRGRIVDLNTLIPPDSGWELHVAEDINDRGFIVGWGTYRGKPRAFLLSPR